MICECTENKKKILHCGSRYMCVHVHGTADLKVSHGLCVGAFCAKFFNTLFTRYSVHFSLRKFDIICKIIDEQSAHAYLSKSFGDCSRCLQLMDVKQSETNSATNKQHLSITTVKPLTSLLPATYSCCSCFTLGFNTTLFLQVIILTSYILAVL